LRIKIANALLDLRFGALLRGGKETSHPHLGAYATNNSSYAAIHTLFRGRVKPTDVLVDVGCGKGRVINAWLAAGYTNRMIGVELDTAIAAKTRERLRQFPDVTIFTGDVVANFPRDGTIFYLFNPFNAAIMSRFKETLKECVSNRSMGEATVIYYNCRHIEVFAEDRSCEIEYGKLEHPYAVIHLLAGRERKTGA
jgi:SAM-dependent methyltransferase